MACFLNLSNHPSERWAETQHTAAVERGGPIYDLAFPYVDPWLSEKELDRLADNTMDQIPNLVVAAMVQGEFGLTFRLVKKLEAAGVICYAATTERVLSQKGEERVYVFRFVQFRKY